MKRIEEAFCRQDEDESKSKRLAQAITELINNDVLKSGDALPPQREIAITLGLSLSVVTQVFNDLKKNGLLYGERGRGTFVAYKTRFAHDIGDRFSLDNDSLDFEDAQANKNLILCNVIERLNFLNDPLPDYIDLGSMPSVPGTLKNYGAAYLRHHGLHIAPQDITISHNAYVALGAAFNLIGRNGVIGTPELSFAPLLSKRLLVANARIVPIMTDHSGILPEALENACQFYGLTALTCSPECEIPTTYRMNLQRRQKIAEIARKYNLTIVENNWLIPGASEPEIPPLMQFAPERTIFLEHGTKMLGNSVFCSFSYVPLCLREEFIYLRNITAGPLGLMARKLTRYWLEKGLVEKEFTKKNTEIVLRNNMAREILAPLPVHVHKYARYCWLPLDKHQSGLKMREKLRQRGILVSSAQNYQIGSICNQDGILIGLGQESERQRLEYALKVIREEILG